VTDNGFDALFAANRIAASVRRKPGLPASSGVGNRTVKRDLIEKYVEAVPMPLEVLPLIEDILDSRVKVKLCLRWRNLTLP